MQGHESAGGRGRKGAPLHAAQAPKHSGGRGEWRSTQGKGQGFDNVETIAEFNQRFKSAKSMQLAVILGALARSTLVV